MHRLKFIVIGLAMALIMAVAAFPMAASASGLTPQTIPGLGGLTAAYIATAGENISGLTISPTTVDGSYDIGIYVGVNNVTITGVNVSGANDEGILVQDASNVSILGSNIHGNGVDTSNISWPVVLSPTQTVDAAEVKGIVLAGTTDCLVQDNTVQHNIHGGISVIDDGPNHVYSPASANLYPPLGQESTGNTITGNTVAHNLNDCGIVVSSKNPGAGLSENTVSDNTITGGTGGIIVAGGLLGPVSVTDTTIQNNVVTQGDIPGISLHAMGPGAISGTDITGNIFSNNGIGEVSGETTGIEIVAGFGGVITGTTLQYDKINNDYYGVFNVGDAGITSLSGTNVKTNHVTYPLFP